MIQAIIDQQEHNGFSGCHFTEFADSSLEPTWPITSTPVITPSP